MIQLAHRPATAAVTPAMSFTVWRDTVVAQGAPPIVAIAGSRGKTTVVRLLDAIFAAAGLRTALWTNRGVEIAGRRQRGELGPWSRVLAGLARDDIDIAIQELDWATVHAVGLPSGVYPVVAITNVCVNNDVCLIQDHTRVALRAREAVFAAVHRAGFLVLNGEDFAVAGDEVAYSSPAIVTAQSKDHPLVRHQVEAGGAAAWLSADGLTFGLAEVETDVCPVFDLRFALGGAARFEVQNALIAASVATAVGIPPAVTGEALREFAVPLTTMPGSFNVLRVGEATAIIDRPSPSWFLRPLVRTISHTGQRRLLIVVGRLEGVPDDDLIEVGRLLGRGGGALIVHSEADAPEQAELLRQGVQMNDVPPVLIHAPTERRAINRAVAMLRPDDTLLVLADQPAAVARALLKAARDAIPAPAAGNLAFRD